MVTRLFCLSRTSAPSISAKPSPSARKDPAVRRVLPASRHIPGTVPRISPMKRQTRTVLFASMSMLARPERPTKPTAQPRTKGRSILQ